MNNNIKKDKNVRKTKNKIEEFDEPLEQPGKIFLAEIHGSAQRLLKIRKLSKYIRFCKCCLLPSETTGIVIPYSCLDNKKDFGLGIFLYFHYIKFCMLITFISLCLSSIPTMVFSIRYSNDLTEHCRLYYNTDNKDNINITNDTNIINNSNDLNLNNDLFTKTDYCLKYLSKNNVNKSFISLDTIIFSDWILKMSSDNINNYYNIFVNNKDIDNKKNIINKIIIDYSFVYFLTGITLLIINFFYVHYFNVLNQADDFEDISPSDFTILVHGVKRPKDNKNIPRKEYLMTLINEISHNYFTLEVHQIIPCYNLVELYKLTKKVFEDKTKIYHVHNFKRQKDLRKKYKYWFGEKQTVNNINMIQNDKDNINTNGSGTNLNINNAIIRNTSQIQILDKNENNINNNNQDYPLNYYTRYCWLIMATPLKKLQDRINKNKERINEIEKDIIENPSKYNCGTYFVVFKYIKMRDKIYDFFPTSIFSKLIMRIKYFFQNIIFSSCVNEKSKRLNYLKLSFTVEHATEAYEVLWKNLGYSQKEKYFYLIISIIVTLLLVGLSLCIVLILNHVQYELTENDTKKNFLRYFLSFLISIFIAITNALGKEILNKVTSKFETIETKTGYYISLSAKFTFFTFINTAIVPLLSNYIRKKWGNNEILLNNVLMIFITNITLTPFLFYISPDLCLKIYRRAKARLDLEGVSLEDSLYTQGELNSIFENPKMDLCYKYSFLANILLTSLFYMSIFPLGTVFSLVALILSYFLETYYLRYYKRPEVLNPRLCKFFIHNFKIVISVFFIGNYIFFSSIDEYHKLNWSFFNFIFFIVVGLVPYHSFEINFLGTTEGEAKKGSYEDYELMFPTDYEKQNPLTKKKAMIKYFKKLEQMNLIDKYQSDYLINNTNKESIMDGFYKTTKNTANILNSYEFQRQFLKLKKKYKYIKKIRQRKILLSSQKDTSSVKEHINDNNDLIINENKLQTIKTIKTLTNINEVHAKDKEDNSSGNEDEYNDKFDGYDVHTIMGLHKARKRKTSQYMRRTLFQQIKNEGIYDESEEENEDDSYESEDNTTNNFILNNKKEKFDFSLVPQNTMKTENSLASNFIKKSRKGSDLSLYSIKTNFKDKDKNTDIKRNGTKNDNIFLINQSLNKISIGNNRYSNNFQE